MLISLTISRVTFAHAQLVLIVHVFYVEQSTVRFYILYVRLAVGKQVRKHTRFSRFLVLGTAVVLCGIFLEAKGAPARPVLRMQVLNIRCAFEINAAWFYIPEGIWYHTRVRTNRVCVRRQPRFRLLYCALYTTLHILKQRARVGSHALPRFVLCLVYLVFLSCLPSWYLACLPACLPACPLVCLSVCLHARPFVSAIAFNAMDVLRRRCLALLATTFVLFAQSDEVYSVCARADEFYFV